MDGSTSEDRDKGGGAGRNDNTVPSQNDTSTKTGKDQVTPKESLTAGSTDELTKVDTKEKSSVEDMANDGSDCNLDASFVIIDNDDCPENPDNNDGANCPDNESQVYIDPGSPSIATSTNLKFATSDTPKSTDPTTSGTPVSTVTTTSGSQKSIAKLIDSTTIVTPTSTDSTTTVIPTSTDSITTVTPTSTDSITTVTPTSTDSTTTVTPTSTDSTTTGTPTSTDSITTVTPTSTDSTTTVTPTSADSTTTVTPTSTDSTTTVTPTSTDSTTSGTTKSTDSTTTVTPTSTDSTTTVTPTSTDSTTTGTPTSTDSTTTVTPTSTDSTTTVTPTSTDSTTTVTPTSTDSTTTGTPTSTDSTTTVTPTSTDSTTTVTPTSTDFTTTVTPTSTDSTTSGTTKSTDSATTVTPTSTDSTTSGTTKSTDSTTTVTPKSTNSTTIGTPTSIANSIDSTKNDALKLTDSSTTGTSTNSIIFGTTPAVTATADLPKFPDSHTTDTPEQAESMLNGSSKFNNFGTTGTSTSNNFTTSGAPESSVSTIREQQHIDKENADDDENLKQMVPGMPPKYLAEDNLQKESTGGQLLSMPVGGEAAGHKKQKTEENASNKPDLKEANPGIVKQIEETPAPEKQSAFDNNKESNQEKRPSSKGGSAMKEQFELTKLVDNMYVINCGPIEFTYTANSTNVRIKNDFLLDDKVVYKLIVEDGEIHKKSMKEIKDASLKETISSSNDSVKNESKKSDTERSHVEADEPDKPEKHESNDDWSVNDLTSSLNKLWLNEGACKPISQKKQSHVVLIPSEEAVSHDSKHIVIHAPHLKECGRYQQFCFEILDISERLRWQLIINNSNMRLEISKIFSNFKISLQQGVLIVGISSDEQHLTQETASKYASDIVDKIHEVTRVFVCMDRKLQTANPQEVLSKIRESHIARDGYLLVELEPNSKVLWILFHSGMHDQIDKMITKVIAGSKETKVSSREPFKMPYIFHHMFDDQEFKDEFQNEFENVKITHSKLSEENSILITLRGESMERLDSAEDWISKKSDDYCVSMSFLYQDKCGSSEEIEEYLKKLFIDAEVKYEINEQAHKVWFYSCTLSQDKLLQRISQAKKCILNNKIRTSIVMSTESDGEDPESHVADKSPSKLPDKPEEVKETGAKPKNIPPKPTPRKNIQNLSKQEPQQQVMDREAIDNSYKNGKTERLVWNKDNMQDSKDHGIIKVKLSKGKSMDDVCSPYKSKLGKHIVVYIKDHEEGLLIYHNYEDALKVYKQLDKSRFYLMTKMTLHNFCQRVDDVKWKSLGEKDKTDLKKKLKSKGVTVNEKEGKQSINAPTAYQIKLAKLIIDSFISDIATECTIKDVSSLVWNTVHVIYQGRIDKLEKDCGREIAFSEEKSEVCFPWSIKGNISDLKKALNDLKEHQIEDIAIKQEELSKVEDACEHVETQNPNVGGCKYDKARKTVFIYGETFEVFTKLKHQWEIKIGRRKQTARGNRGAAKVVTQETAEEGKIDVPALASKKMPIEQKTFDTDIGIKVIIYQGSILNLPVECIVNAANGGLNHGAGVARVIADAAGKDLERESKNYIKRYGELSDGSACSTTAGKIYNYKLVIHTVGPRWSEYSRKENGRQRCEKALVSAVKNAFHEADNCKMKSLALPAISSAIFGVPLDICVKQYVRAVEEYCEYRMNSDTGTLSEIHFIDIKREVVRAIQNAFTSFFSPSTKRTPHSSSAVMEGAHGDQNMLPEPLMYEKNLETHVFLFTGNNDNDGLLLCRGNIENITDTKAVIIPVNESGKGGRIENIILQKVDNPTYKSHFDRERQHAFSGRKSIGDVVKVNGYGCGFPCVLYVVYPRDEQTKSMDYRKQSLGKVIQSILRTAEEDRDVHSIALPMFGIDSNNNKDVELFSSALVEQYRAFCEEKYKQSSEDYLTVKVVCPTYKMFDFARKILVDYVKQFKDDYNKDEAEDSDVNDEEQSEEKNGAICDASLGPCVICMDTITEPKTIQCGHTFCTDCIDQQFQYKKQCPTCFQVCGVITGDQPEGTMIVSTDKFKHQPGYEAYGTITITYKFPSGNQQANHPSPGQFYKGIIRSAYLPNNSEGRKVLKMLKLAFDRKLTFTIGNSRTTGQQGVITWNDIHHKTDHRPNTQFGYPDPTYLERVKDELAAKGITEADIENT